MRPSVAWLVFAAAACAAGCRSNSALVESELRQREGQLRELQDEVDRCGAYNQALEQELHNLREGLPPCAPGLGTSAYPVRSLVLGRGTGGRDVDGLPGDEALEVHIEPRDPEGNTVKAPGSANIQVAEIGPDGIKRPLPGWEISPEQLRHSWKSGLLTTAYVLVLPWKVWPSTEKVRVTVQFRLADGRLFEADRDVSVHVAPGNQRLAPGVPALTPGTEGPAVGEELPPPRPSPGGAKPGATGPAVKDPSVRPAAEILRPVPVRPVSGGGSWSAPTRTSPSS